jgi:hypothetical protein
VINKVTFSEYKRRQAAPGLKVSPRAFGMGRRIPIAQKFRARNGDISAKGSQNSKIGSNRQQ